MHEFSHRPPRLDPLRARLSHLSEDEIDAAEARFWRYTLIVRRIFLRKIEDAERSAPPGEDSTNPDLDSRVESS